MRQLPQLGVFRSAQQLSCLRERLRDLTVGLIDCRLGLQIRVLFGIGSNFLVILSERRICHQAIQFLKAFFQRRKTFQRHI
ncbi:MAG: hypothetical protein BWY25_01502 [Chloroflexi bacterium ADurb.Bin222]|nr:MAG: hypothetical protein BWY25_01502 [Chloroflexi bacterium ADurb.Bin222]